MNDNKAAKNLVLSESDRKEFIEQALAVLEEIGLGPDQLEYAIFAHVKGDAIAADIKRRLP